MLFKALYSLYIKKQTLPALNSCISIQSCEFNLCTKLEYTV